MKLLKHSNLIIAFFVGIIVAMALNKLSMLPEFYSQDSYDKGDFLVVLNNKGDHPNLKDTKVYFDREDFETEGQFSINGTNRNGKTQYFYKVTHLNNGVKRIEFDQTPAINIQGIFPNFNKIEYIKDISISKNAISISSDSVFKP